jgi:hypothetical protein
MARYTLGCGYLCKQHTSSTCHGGIQKMSMPAVICLQLPGGGASTAAARPHKIGAWIADL